MGITNIINKTQVLPFSTFENKSQATSFWRRFYFYLKISHFIYFERKYKHNLMKKSCKTKGKKNHKTREKKSKNLKYGIRKQEYKSDDLFLRIFRRQSIGIVKTRKESINLNNAILGFRSRFVKINLR